MLFALLCTLRMSDFFAATDRIRFASLFTERIFAIAPFATGQFCVAKRAATFELTRSDREVASSAALVSSVPLGPPQTFVADVPVPLSLSHWRLSLQSCRPPAWATWPHVIRLLHSTMMDRRKRQSAALSLHETPLQHLFNAQLAHFSARCPPSPRHTIRKTHLHANTCTRTHMLALFNDKPTDQLPPVLQQREDRELEHLALLTGTRMKERMCGESGHSSGSEERIAAHLPLRMGLHVC
ncbi:unnamed protein product [Protopolystoma xenopodis]|uniref:Uncharacterized protein n=1 Tax=Protopolystoma xenopodis TaxID=117903 RepID=A0A448WM64_9PLAT|nr:unnamed protein product [Protopolystoma xenopodis]